MHDTSERDYKTRVCLAGAALARGAETVWAKDVRIDNQDNA